MTNVCVFSGGLDSTVLLYELLGTREQVIALTFDYGQRHATAEMIAAFKIAEIAASKYGRLKHRVIQIGGFSELLPGSSQTDKSVAVPHGHYADESMKATIVPNRNMVMLSIAAGVAMAHGGGFVYFGVHAGDYAIYNDCREQFVNALDDCIGLADDRKTMVKNPYSHMTKTAIVKNGAKIGVPFELTYSCYKGHTEHCGACGTCIERREAFRDAGIIDPTTYNNAAPDLDAALEFHEVKTKTCQN